MGKMVLIVDDSTTQQFLVKQALEGQGYDIMIANNGLEALEKVSSTKPDLVILDVVMPGKDGFQVCREIRQTPELKDTRVILLSAKNQQVDQYWGKKQGADEYLTKPCSADHLLSVVKKLI